MKHYIPCKKCGGYQERDKPSLNVVCFECKRKTQSLRDRSKPKNPPKPKASPKPKKKKLRKVKVPDDRHSYYVDGKLCTPIKTVI